MNSADNIANTSICTESGTLKKESTIATKADGINQMATMEAVIASVITANTITAIQKNGI